MSKRFPRVALSAVVCTLLASGANAAETTIATEDPSVLNAEDDQPVQRFIITYRNGSTLKAKAAAIAQKASTALTRAGISSIKQVTAANHLRTLATGSELIKASRNLDRAEAEAFMQQLAADPEVESVEPDVLSQPDRDIEAPQALEETFTPNDASYSSRQWHLKAPDGTATKYGAANYGGSNVSNAWNLADGNGITIAVLDTGITKHVDVDTSLADAGYDFITESSVSGRATDGRAAGGWDLGNWTTEEPWLSKCTDEDKPPAKSNWHGTHVASTAGAELTNNSVGMAGVAYKAKILPVRVLGHCGGYESDIADAIVWAAGGEVDGVPVNKHPAQVINLSLGGSRACKANSAYAKAIAKANALGAVVVASAGNSNVDAAKQTPASCPGVITVAAVGITSKRAHYSNYGSKVEIAAPGGGVYENDASSGEKTHDGFVWQAVNSSKTSPDATSTKYSGKAGTSQAAPHVSGVVALMQSARLDAGLPLLKPSEVLSLLQRTARTPSVTPEADKPIGAGIVDAAAAVKAAISSTTINTSAE